MYSYMSKEKLQNWIELTESKMVCEPSCDRSNMRIQGIFENGVKWELDCVAIKTVGKVKFYGRQDDWDTVKVYNYYGTAMHFFGKGARSQETSKNAEMIFDLLVN